VRNIKNIHFVVDRSKSEVTTRLTANMNEINSISQIDDSKDLKQLMDGWHDL
jgi:spore coat polysaccharide biosynthesis predicted glycosyltransferase SpsG